MKKDVIVKPDEIIQTFIRHPEEPKHKKTRECLDNLLAQGNMTENVPAITLVDDNGSMMVYRGFVRAQHAKEHNYSLKADVISSQSDLTSYINEYYPQFFNIRNFDDLLSVMRLYAKSPMHDKKFEGDDLELVRKMISKYDPNLYDDMQIFSGWYKNRKMH